jgi:pimeloyl-ACP methyl ester carboxylesterase
LSKWGYRAFAIDIPSPKSNSFSGKDNQEAIQLLTQIIDTLHLRNLVIISPSMSGRLTLPYMFELRDEQKLIKGFVPIAPVGTNHFSANDYKQLKVSCKEFFHLNFCK